ncbi:hypothetical protein OQJ65_01295 [Vibrio sp. Sgm 22]|uniref:hypothetical protein n=1 Tax=unclassified Vibrio TaxID=2614977 RepID=UPI00224977B5|nr:MULTISPECIES: hypothetical protein [unclassified Vibrio]MCX2756995.1 hypothetical protein [Vibrio sp. 14G-20]MCX2773956.1 hypothetical protein [Vibrio sp. Sgm 22]
MKGLLIAISLMWFSPTLLADCANHWAIKIDNSNITYKRDMNAYIPMYIEFAKNRENCQPRFVTFYLHNKNSQQFISAGSNAKLPIKVLNRSFSQLSYASGKGVIIPLEGQITKFWLQVEQAKVAHANTYNGTAHVQFKQENKTYRKTQKVALTVAPFVSFSPDTADSNLVNRGKNKYRFLLGELTTNQSYSTNFLLISNANVQIEVSQRYGKLRHSQEHENQIPYQLTVNNANVSRYSRSAVPSTQQLNRKNIPLRVKVGNTDFARAGIYSDTITLKVTVMP